MCYGTVNSNVLPFNLKLFRTKMDIKSVIRDYSLKAILAVGPKSGGTRTVCDIEITGTLSVYLKFEHLAGFHQKIKAGAFFKGCSTFLHLFKKNCILIYDV